MLCRVCSARDYIAMHRDPDAKQLRQTMDDFVLNLVNDEQFESLENLLVAGYNHVLDIKGLRRNRVVGARDIAVLKEFKDIIELLDDWTHYQVRVQGHHRAARRLDALPGESSRTSSSCSTTGRTNR